MPQSHRALWFTAIVVTAALPLAAAKLSFAHDQHSSAMAPAASSAAPAAEQPFLDGNDAAMTKMMAGMTIKPTGDIDKDFVAMMIPHHQGAIDMALLQLRYGRNQKLKNLAQEIIVTQQQEIAAMRLAVGEPLPPSVASPTTATAPAAMHAHTSNGN